MKRLRVASGVLASLVAGFVLLVIPKPQAGVGHEDAAAPAAAIKLPERPVELLIELGIEDEEQVRWKGELKLSEGRVLSLELVQGSRDSKLDGSAFDVRTARRPGKAPARRKQGAKAQTKAGAKQPKAGAKAKKQQAAQPKKAARKAAQAKKQAAGAAAEKPFHLVPARIRATLDAPLSAKAEVVTSHGSFSFALEDATQGKPQTFLDGQAAVSGELAAVRLTAAKTEDDFPVMAQGSDGTVWLAYVAYTAGPPILMDRILQGGFEALEPKGNGDQIRLMRFDGKQWHAPINATEGNLDLWRPTISVDGQGVVWLVWAQPVDGNWEIFSRRYTPGDGAAAG
ncbi:MAG TPA: hypothetical protein VHC19_08215, partial [Pirellulales bacterium]|nr:hypothetical protein [Pirellulales bacterium]